MHLSCRHISLAKEIKANWIELLEFHVNCCCISTMAGKLKHLPEHASWFSHLIGLCNWQKRLQLLEIGKKDAANLVTMYRLFK